MGLHLENEVALVKTLTVISNNPVFFINRTYSAPVRYETKTWNVVLLNKKTYTPFSSVLFMTSC